MRDQQIKERMKPAGSDVVHRAGVFDSERTGHGASISKREAKVKHSIPDPEMFPKVKHSIPDPEMFSREVTWYTAPAYSIRRGRVTEQAYQRGMRKSNIQYLTPETLFFSLL
jgi:hypothetical protein